MSSPSPASSHTSTCGGTRRPTSSSGGWPASAGSFSSTSAEWACPTVPTGSRATTGSTTFAAVLDATGSQRAVVLGISAGTPTAALFAARHPDRCATLVLYGGYARFLRGDGYDIGQDAEGVAAFVDQMEAEWGTGVGLSLLAPSRSDDPEAQSFWARLQTMSASPAAAATFLRTLATVDIRDALPTIAAPTLLLHPERDLATPVEGARVCQQLIPGARLVELDSDIHLIWLSDVIDTITAEIETFIDEAVGGIDAEPTLLTLLAIAGETARLGQSRLRSRRSSTATEAGAFHRAGSRPLRARAAHWRARSRSPSRMARSHRASASIPASADRTRAAYAASPSTWRCNSLRRPDLERCSSPRPCATCSSTPTCS